MPSHRDLLGRTWLLDNHGGHSAEQPGDDEPPSPFGPRQPACGGILGGDANAALEVRFQMHGGAVVELGPDHAKQQAEDSQDPRCVHASEPSVPSEPGT